MVAAPPASKILVIQTAFLGDIVLTTPFLANLRELAPQAEIRLLTTPIGARVLTPNPFGVTVVPYDKRGADRGFKGFLRIAREHPASDEVPMDPLGQGDVTRAALGHWRERVAEPVA